MQEVILLILTYLRGIWRYRWAILVTAVVVCPIGWVYVALLPDEYQAEAKVYVDTQSVLKPLLRGLAVDVDEGRRLSLMTKTLLARPNLEKLARMTDLDLKAKTPQQMDNLVASLKNRVYLNRAGRINIYNIRFRDESPVLAKRMVQSLLTIFVESNLGETRKDQDSAEQFLVRQIKDYERRMIDAERKLKEFKARNLAFVSDQGGYYSRLQQVQGQLQQAKLDLQIVEERRDELQQQLQDVEDEGEEMIVTDEGEGMVEPEMLSPTDARIQEAKTQLEELLVRYTERHPDVIALKKSIARLEKQSEQEKATEMSAFGPDDQALNDGSGDRAEVLKSLNANPLYQQARLMLSEAEADMAAKQAIVREYERRRDELGKAVDRVLQVETEQKQLNRDYSVLKQNYNALTKRLESAKMTRKADSSAEIVRFRIIEPPRVPQKPEGPKRIVLSSAVFGGALSAGLALAFLLFQLRPTFSNRRQLNDLIGLPVLGSINMIWTASERHRMRLMNLTFGLGFGGLLLAFGLLVAVYAWKPDLVPRLLSIS